MLKAEEDAHISFRQGVFVVIASPPPDAFWLAQALTDIRCVDSGQPISAGADETASLYAPVRFLERVASFPNGDDLYKTWKDERVRKTAIVCAAHLQLRDGTEAPTILDPPAPASVAPPATTAAAAPAATTAAAATTTTTPAAAGAAAAVPATGTNARQFVLPLAERHRIVAFLSSTYGADTPAEAVLSDGLGVYALVSSASFNNSAFVLVKWAGLECAMTWEPRALLAEACPELLERYENAPYKLAISFPPPQPQPIFEMPPEMMAGAAEHDARASGAHTRGGSTAGKKGRGRGRGRTRTASPRASGAIAQVPVPVPVASPSALKPHTQDAQPDAQQAPETKSEEAPDAQASK